MMKTVASTALAFVALTATSLAGAGDNRSFGAHLVGDEEVPSNESRAQGQALFKVSQDGTEISYKLIVSNIENVVAAHIHEALPGVNGPVVVPLFGPAAPGGGRTDGVLAEGTITGAPVFIGGLIERMEAGLMYVNVHTNDGIAPVNTGPGDFPGGEIRGQIR